MKTFKFLICVSVMTVLLTACGGKVPKNMSAPENAPTCKIEAVDRAVNS